MLGKTLPWLGSGSLGRLRSLLALPRCGGSSWLCRHPKPWEGRKPMGGQASTCLGPCPAPPDPHTGMGWDGAGGAAGPGAEEPRAACSAALREFHPKTTPWDSRAGWSLTQEVSAGPRFSLPVFCSALLGACQRQGWHGSTATPNLPLTAQKYQVLQRGMST